jgi:hypothetical protein
MKKNDEWFDQNFFESKYEGDDYFENDVEADFHSYRKGAITSEKKYFLFQKIERDLKSVVRVHTEALDAENEFEEKLNKRFYSEFENEFDDDAKHQHQFKLHQEKIYLALQRLKRYQYFIAEVACIMEASLRHFDAVDIQIILGRVNDALLEHPFTSTDADVALTQIEKVLPVTFDLYSGVIKRVSSDTDNRLIRHFLKNGEVQFEDVVKLIPVYAVKHSFDALAVIFKFWLIEKPFDPVTHREEIGEMGWNIILGSHAYTGLYLNPDLDGFLRRFEDELSGALPLLTKYRSTLRNLPSYQFTAALKASGYTSLALAIGTRLRDIDNEHIQGKFIGLKRQGVEVSETFIKNHLSSASSIPGWTMAMEYYLQDDDMHFDLDDLYMPGIQAQGKKFDPSLITRQTLIKLLGASFPTPRQDEKSMTLARNYTTDNPVLIKELLEAGLPEKYLAVEHIREEKLFLDLGL